MDSTWSAIVATIPLALLLLLVLRLVLDLGWSCFELSSSMSDSDSESESWFGLSSLRFFARSAFSSFEERPLRRCSVDVLVDRFVSLMNLSGRR